MNNLAPIVLFVYNRPKHTKKTIDSLSKNLLANKSKLIVFADGPKKNATKEDRGNINKVRKIVKNIKWCKEIEIYESKINRGLANSIISGVTEVVNKHGKIIVLEDDLVTSKYFLKFMNEGLQKYEKQDRVLGIHGYVYPVKGRLPKTFFLKDPGCWGWATWKRAWNLFEKDGTKLLKEIRDKKLKYEFDCNGSYPFTKMLEDQISGKNDSWAIRWKAACLLNNKLVLYPGVSLTNNIGNDNSGIHSGKTRAFNTRVSKKEIVISDIKITEMKEAVDIYANYFRDILNKKNLLLKTVGLVRNIKNYISFYVSINSNKNIARVNNFVVNYTDRISIKYEYEDIYINEIYKFKSDIDKPVIIDGGGGIGMSVLYFKEKFPESKIFTFEPDPSIYKILLENVNNNKLQGVTCINEGLGKKIGLIKFFSDNSDGGSIYTNNHSGSKQDLKVKINKLSNYITEPVDLLKLNIEGMESEVIEEIENKISLIKNIIIEYHCFSNLDQSLGRILNVLDRGGFRYVVTEATNARIPKNPNLYDPYKFFNIIYASRI